MNHESNTTCTICGKSYYMCLSCKDLMQLKPWKVHTDTSEHYKIYQIIHGYTTGVFNKDEAKKRLQTVDLSDFDDLRDNIKKIITLIKNEDIQTEVKDSSAGLSEASGKSTIEQDKTTRRK